MEQYLLILHDPADSPLATMSPEETQSVIARYSAWAGEMAEKGCLRGGEKLADGEGRHMIGRAGQTRIIDGPFPETKEVIGGYFVIAAAGYDEAVAIASTCPHLDFGRIEVRRIEPTN
jgi:hypothetical protein